MGTMKQKHGKAFLILGATLLVGLTLDAAEGGGAAATTGGPRLSGPGNGGHAAMAQRADGRRLVWSDEFDGTSLDNAKSTVSRS